MTELDDPPQNYPVHGRDLMSGIPKEIIVTYKEIAGALNNSIEQIEEAIMSALFQTPPALSADIYNVTKEGEIDMDHLEKLLNEKTKILSITHISNTLGTINPISEITKLARKFDTKVFIDGAQAIAHQKVNVDIFYVAHDPTQVNRQGNDIGRHYRSIILYGSKEEETVVSHTVVVIVKTGGGTGHSGYGQLEVCVVVECIRY